MTNDASRISDWFEPKHSLQDGLEFDVTRKLSLRFPQTFQSGSAVSWCASVQAASLDLIAESLLEELRLRAGSALVPRHHRQFDLFGLRYKLYLEHTHMKGAGTIGCCLKRADVPEKHQAFRRKSMKFSMSLTAHGVRVITENSLAPFLFTAINIIHRIVLSTNGWILQHLEEANRQSSSNALKAIRALLIARLGDLADEILIYPYRDNGNEFVGQYVMDNGLFERVVDRIRRTMDGDVPRSQQISALIDTTMGIELTESRKVLAQRKPGVIEPAVKNRLYEAEHLEFLTAEDATYGTGPIVIHPIVFSEEIMDVQMIMAYPFRIRDINDGVVPRTIENLRAKILDILRTEDIISPLVTHFNPVSKIAKGTQPPSESLQKEICILLHKYADWPPPDGDRLALLLSIKQIIERVNSITDLKKLTQLKLACLTSNGPSLGTIWKLKGLLDANT